MNEMTNVFSDFDYIKEDIKSLVPVDFKEENIGDEKRKYDKLEINECLFADKNRTIFIKDSHSVIHKYVLSEAVNARDYNLLIKLIPALLKGKAAHPSNIEFYKHKEGFILTSICEWLVNEMDLISELVLERLIVSLIDWLGRRNEGDFPNLSLTIFNQRVSTNPNKITIFDVINTNAFERINSIESLSYELDADGIIDGYISVVSKNKSTKITAPTLMKT